MAPVSIFEPTDDAGTRGVVIFGFALGAYLWLGFVWTAFVQPWVARTTGVNLCVVCFEGCSPCLLARSPPSKPVCDPIPTGLEAGGALIITRAIRDQRACGLDPEDPVVIVRWLRQVCADTPYITQRVHVTRGVYCDWLEAVGDEMALRAITMGRVEP